MAKLGAYSYPDIRFGDAVEIAGRVLTKFKGTVSVKGLAWELGMAEGSGTLFAKVAALRDFGLIDGRGELKVTPLAQRVLYPAGSDEGRRARAEAFQRVELLRMLFERFQAEMPDDASLLIGLEELTKAPRDEIVRRAPLIQKHLADAVRILSKPATAPAAPMPRKEYVAVSQATAAMLRGTTPVSAPAVPSQIASATALSVQAGGLQLSAPLTVEFIDIAIQLLQTARMQLTANQQTAIRPEAAPAVNHFEVEDDLDELGYFRME